ncbi:MAG: FixH family protein [Polyangiaceae bacterium]
MKSIRKGACDDLPQEDNTEDGATIYLMVQSELHATLDPRMKSETALFAAAAWLLSACSGGAAPGDSNTQFSQNPLLSLMTDSAQLSVEVRTLPSQPPVLGDSSVQLIIRDAASGEPESGLDLKVVPWMPAMGHGTAITPTVTETEPGTYDLTGVVLFMPGTWQLRTVLTGAVTDHVVPSFQVR